MSPCQTPPDDPPIPLNDPAPNILVVEESFREADLEEVLDDLSSRFILNMPEPELSSTERISFQIEQAHWYYEDFVRPLNPNFPSLSLKRFSALLFKTCPLLNEWSHEQAFEDFQKYKSRVPVCGAILMNAKMDKCVLVKGWKSSSAWSFPKGKINQDESRDSCAVREVREETGYDFGAAGLLDKRAKAEMEINQQSLTLYFVVGVPEDTVFQTQTRKEISKIEWFKLQDLPTWSKKRAIKENGKFYLISPFVSSLKSFVHARRPSVSPAVATTAHQPQILQPSNGVPAGPRPREPSIQKRVVSSSQESAPRVDLVDLDPRPQPDALVLGESDKSSSPGPVTPPTGSSLGQRQTSTSVPPSSLLLGKHAPIPEDKADRMSHLLSGLSVSGAAPIPSLAAQSPSSSLPPTDRGSKHIALLESLFDMPPGPQGLAPAPPPAPDYLGTITEARKPPPLALDPRMPPPPNGPPNARFFTPGPIPTGPWIPGFSPQFQMGPPPPMQEQPQQSPPPLHNPQATYPYYPPAAFPNGKPLTREEADHKGAMLSMLSNRPISKPPQLQQQHPQMIYQSPMPSQALQNGQMWSMPPPVDSLERGIAVPMPPQRWGTPALTAGMGPSPGMPSNGFINGPMQRVSPTAFLVNPPLNGAHPNGLVNGHGGYIPSGMPPNFRPPVNGPDPRLGAGLPDNFNNPDFPYAGPSPAASMHAFLGKGGAPRNAYRQHIPQHSVPNATLPNRPNDHIPRQVVHNGPPNNQYNDYVPPPQPVLKPARAQQPDALLAILNSGRHPAA